MRKKKTQRGFGYYEFTDRNGIECSLQASSLATESAIWLGADKIGIKEFVAHRQPNAWEDLTQFDEEFSHSLHYVANNRMHLTQRQVKKLLPILTKFAETGEL